MGAWILLTLVGCLERVTGEEVPLDPRFYAGVQDADDQPTDPNGGGGGSQNGEAPWSGYDGETVHVVGKIVSETAGAIQIDVNEPDATAPGGQRRAGALHLAGPGDFEVDVPKDVASFRIQAFQDLAADGPTADDPFAEAAVDLSAGPPADLVLTLVKGARGNGAAGSGAPGSPGGDPNGGGSAAPPPPEGLNLPAGGTRVVLSGKVTVARDLPVVLDFFHADGEGQGGRTYLGRRVIAPGDFTQDFPVEYGPVEIEAYQDLTGDSRTGDDPAARLETPVVIGSEDVSGIVLQVP